MLNKKHVLSLRDAEEERTNILCAHIVVLLEGEGLRRMSVYLTMVCALVALKNSSCVQVIKKVECSKVRFEM